ncbi:xanthine dehydrogenase/oxidase-like [Aplysia californica]|uniref:Xanthine dehydrogenase/oxidase-like n=1 Tax=Aplysia californica TaxID=6500 RepID=A0ABM1VWH5_APLCA|nr:xanthine dehydrogenase/oxidase-like [Aplysia californica]
MVEVTEAGLRVGAAASIQGLRPVVRAIIEELPEHKSRGFAALLETMSVFASTQIRNVASIGGNIVTANAVSDINPFLLATGATLQVMDTEGKTRDIAVEEKFFLPNGQTSLSRGDIIVSVLIPYTTEGEFVQVYKQSSRGEVDRAVVNAAMRLVLTSDLQIVSDVSLVFGGMGDRPLLASRTMKALQGRKWDRSLVEFACSADMLPSDLPLAPDSQGGMVAYRRTLTLSIFFRFFLSVSEKLGRIWIEKRPAL